MQKLKILNIIFVVFVIFSFSVFPSVNAQTTTPVKNGFSISPPSFDINAKPGDVLSETIKIENISTQKLDLTTKVQNFVAYGDEGQILLTEDDSTYSINSWITFQNPEFSVEPKEIKEFNFFINIPSNAQPGSHFGSVVFSTSTTSTDPNAAKVVQEIGSVILIKLPGEVFESAKINSFKSDKDYFTDPKVKLDSLLQNDGSVIVQPSGTITVQDIFGNTVQTIEVPAKNILPGSQRIFDQEFDFDKVGYFKAKLDLNYGNSQTLSAETTFVALYTQRLIPITLLSLALIILYLIFRKRINRAIRVIVKGE